MKKRAILCFPLLFLIFTNLGGQETEKFTEQTLKDLFDRLSITSDDSSRISINDSIDNFIGLYVRSDSVFKYKFRNIRYLGQILSEDGHVKIINWNLLLRNAKSRYYCYFINRTGNTNSVYRLIGSYREEPVRTDAMYSDSDWYGALYYEVRPFKKENHLYWILLGVDYGNPSITRKIIDIVEFQPERRMTFGRKIFISNLDTTYRALVEYSSEAVVSLKFNSDKAIIFDHLVPVSSEFRNNRDQYGPEYSYDGYVLDKGFWRFRENVDMRNKRQ